MTEAETKRGVGNFVVLGVAIIVTVAIGVWAFIGSGNDSAASPAFEQLPADDVVTESSSGDTGVPAALGVIDAQRPEVGQLAPDFALVDGRDAVNVIRLSDFRGTPVVLNWYATWCGPCRAEIPDFKAAQDSLGDQIVFLGVNLQETPEKAVGLLDEFDATYPIVLDQDGSVFEHYRGLGMPTTFFIDADGIIVESGTGRMTEDALVTALGHVGIEYQPPGDD